MSRPMSSCGFRFWIPKKYPVVQNKEDCLCCTMDFYTHRKKFGKRDIPTPHLQYPGQETSPEAETSDSEYLKLLISLKAQLGSCRGKRGKKGAISEDGPDSNVPGKRKCIPLPPEVTSESEKSRFLRFNETPPHNALRPGSIEEGSESRSGCGSLEVNITSSLPACHEFEPSIAEDAPWREGSSKVERFPIVVVWKLGEEDAISGVLLVN
ncbi:hypothetical protein TNCV_494851 [Trichonephila clavipes]|nr:hypothetical protein TNCV_494851 [Trichonephila clavipes]